MIEKLQTEKILLMREISTLTGLFRGSWVERFSTCSNKKCRCHTHPEHRHGPRRYLVVNENGKQKQKYIPNRLVTHVKEGIAQYQRLKEISNRLTAINLILMKEDS
jgi:hypothetical protein